MPIHANTIKQLANNDPNLTRVIVVKKNLTDHDIAPLLSALKNNTHLEYLDLSHNLLTNRSGHQLKEILLKNGNLFHLNISHNYIHPKYIDQIDFILWERKKLEALCGSSQRRHTKSFWQAEPDNESTNPEQWDDANNDAENATSNTFSLSFSPK